MTRRSRWLAVLGGLCLVACSSGGRFDRTETDLFLVELWSEQGLMMPGEPRNLTQRPGYDNQPAFLADGRSILYVSRDRQQSDLYRYDLDELRSERLTDSPEREYSPQPLPDASGISAVRVEANQELGLWRFDGDGGNAQPLRVPVRDPVLYYAWIDADNLALYVESDTTELVLADLSAGRSRTVARDIGRSLQLVPGRRAISFVQHETPADWWITELDLDTGETRRLARTVQGREDHAWTPSGQLLMASGSVLYLIEPGDDAQWQPIADFRDAGLRDISRIAINPEGNLIALAAESE